ncbi:UNVERIFIED_CONTAM: hypothetical protein Slati_4473800 [Sesamum latifolium]|uniref:Uncharacterized protein n=1 Tax=Sesamum latifolium TaxID=2727402 RepID=A0AAW2SR81_9LAMI
MPNSDNGGDSVSYEGNSSLPTAAGLSIPLADPAIRVANAPAPNLIVGANASTLALALDAIAGPIAMNPLFYEQLR